jgi:hypothetical protein
VQKGRGSSRDTLSALDQVVAAGGVVARAEPVEQLYESLAAQDPGRAVAVIADALAQGHDPRVLGAAFVDSLRDAFLVSLHVDVPHLPEQDRDQYGRWAAALGTAALTRAMETVGAALVEMRQAADPRVPLEVALVRLTMAPDDSVAGLVERIEQHRHASVGSDLVEGLRQPHDPVRSGPRCSRDVDGFPTPDEVVEAYENEWRLRPSEAFECRCKERRSVVIRPHPEFVRQTLHLSPPTIARRHTGGAVKETQPDEVPDVVPRLPTGECRHVVGVQRCQITRPGLVEGAFGIFRYGELADVHPEKSTFLHGGGHQWVDRPEVLADHGGPGASGLDGENSEEFVERLPHVDASSG